MARTRTWGERGARLAAALTALLVPLAPLAARAGGSFPVGQPFSLVFSFPDTISCSYEIVQVGVTPSIASPLSPPQFVTGAQPETFALDFLAGTPGMATASVTLIGQPGCRFSATVANRFEIAEGKTPPPDQVLVIDPSSVSLGPFETRRFRALIGPVDENGDPDFGPDGIPGNADDAFELVSVQWSVEAAGSRLGSVSPETGTTTVFTPEAPGDSGQVVATLGAMRASASIFIDTPGDGDFFGFRGSSADPVYNFSLHDVGLGNDPADLSRTLVAPGTDGTQGASLQSVDPAGTPIEQHTIPFEIDSATNTLVSMPIVAVPAGGSIPGGPSGGFLFVQAQGGGSLIARRAGFPDAVASVAGAPTHVLNLEVERMLRHGLPLADDAPPGATQVVARPTTFRELTQSLDQLQIDANVLPFDASASLHGQVWGSMRTIAGVDPANLAAMRQQILDDVARTRGNPDDPGDVERFLRRNPDRGRVVVSLGAPIDRALSTGQNAYLGAADAGFLGYREDLLLREAQRELLVPDRSGAQRRAIVVTLVENPEVTNVVPYLEFLRARERNRIRRDPSRGGIFQNSGQPGFGQLVVAADGSGHRRYPIGTTNGSSAFLYAANAGEGSAGSAFAAAHLVGHLLFGDHHDGSDPLSILQAQPPEDPAFFVSSFDGFHYADGTLRRGRSHLDRRWSKP